ncbi:hypothetical protein B0O80DRAFT_301847 [Mortierella sp. GBAus27b]|nr:hypothetical protein B0O80DRAFT_301847 [Mortierella sp. GBAus27b]
MIRSNAWGPSPTDAETSAADTYSQSHEQDYEDDHELMDTEGCSMTSMTSYGESQCLSESTELASDSNDMPLIPTIHPSIDQLNVDVRRSARDQGAERDNGEGGGDNAADMDDSEDYLPELTVSFTDPEKGRFEEILYWLYTGDDRRWLSYFTPENYETILQIILELRIVTKSVLDICLAFETMTSPEQGLRGKAHDVFFGPDGNTTYAVPTGSH